MVCGVKGGAVVREENAAALVADEEAARAECPVWRGDGRIGEGDCVKEVEEVGSGVKPAVDVASEGVAFADVDDVGSGVHVVTVVTTAGVLTPDVGCGCCAVSSGGFGGRVDAGTADTVELGSGSAACRNSMIGDSDEDEVGSDVKGGDVDRGAGVPTADVDEVGSGVHVFKFCETGAMDVEEVGSEVHS